MNVRLQGRSGCTARQFCRTFTGSLQPKRAIRPPGLYVSYDVLLTFIILHASCYPFVRALRGVHCLMISSKVAPSPSRRDDPKRAVLRGITNIACGFERLQPCS
jgi:hypothetical protein